MSPEEKQILIQTHRLVGDNNKLLRKMHRAAIWGRVGHLLYWIVIIGLSVGAYYFVEPYVTQLQGVYGGVQTDLQSVSKLLNAVKK